MEAEARIENIDSRLLSKVVSYRGESEGASDTEVGFWKISTGEHLTAWKMKQHYVVLTDATQCKKIWNFLIFGYGGIGHFPSYMSIIELDQVSS